MRLGLALAAAKLRRVVSVSASTTCNIAFNVALRCGVVRCGAVRPSKRRISVLMQCNAIEYAGVA